MFQLFATGVVDTGGQICHRCRWYQWQIAAGAVDTGGKFAAGVNNTSETGGKFEAGVVDTGGAPLLVKNSKQS